MKEQLKGGTPAENWKKFLEDATILFVQKDTDYDSRFLKALFDYWWSRGDQGPEAARTIWAWEVEKKLDRCRTWIKRGELLVKGEGIENSVMDAFIYTVQYQIFINFKFVGNRVFHVDDREKYFRDVAERVPPEGWVSYWLTEDLIKKGEQELINLLLNEMRGPGGPL